MYGNFAAHAGVISVNIDKTERGNLYFSADQWVSSSGKAGIGNWFFTSGIGTNRYITDSTTNASPFTRSGIGNLAFFFAPSTGNASNYLDAYFNLVQTVPSNRKIRLDSNYYWNGGFRTIEYMTGIGNDGVFRIEHGGGTDSLFLRTGTTFSETTYGNIFRRAVTTEVGALVNGLGQQTGTRIQLRETALSNYFYEINLPIAQPIKQIHIYVGGVLANNITEQERYGMFVNNIKIVNWA
jgi:hypothetical protein